ncbi:glycosyltransferase [Vibrio sp. MMG022]|uniref:glycosyltransferase n=1 Tax=Vibrio sp. MMG023 TaxID=2909979 RepID=UPI001F1CC4C5|nr:glycosyltransferase [Vibrio sp. MMG023]MCF6453895.1 glycosyltransferase [Vibrio sp. MMG023]
MFEQDKRTAILINSLSCGGAEKVASILAQDISNIKWICKIIPGDDFFHISREKVKVINLGFYSGSNVVFKLFNYIYAIFAFFIFLVKEKPINVMSFLHASHIILFFSNIINPNLNRIYCERSLIDKSYAGLKKKIIIGILKRAFSSNSIVIAISNEVIAGLKCNGINPKEYFVIYNPIEERDSNLYMEFHSQKETDLELDRKTKLVTVSRLNKIKNIDFMLDFISENKEHFTLDIIGDGPELISLKERCSMLGIEEAVSFHGAINRPFEVAKESDIFVYSSKYESFGNVCMEAASYGIPVVLPKYCGALEEIFSISKNSGSFFYNSNDQLSFKASIENLKDNKSKLFESSDLLFKYSKEFSRRKIVDQYYNVVFFK